jgi:DNA-binding CsgD family transcriptional regulator
MQSRHKLREQIFAAATIDEAVGVLAQAVGELGINRLITGYVGGPAQDAGGGWRTYKHRSFNFPAGWDEAWDRYNPHCPYYHACFDGRVAFDWASVRTRHDLSPKEKKAWHYLADFDLIKGFTVPIHAPGYFGFVTVVGEGGDRSWARRIDASTAPLLFLSHVYHEAARERFPAFFREPEKAPISDREHECLRWAAAGKTTAEVAAILGLSQETVRVYFKRVMRKLDATNRTQAVARAFGAGYLG